MSCWRWEQYEQGGPGGALGPPGGVWGEAPEAPRHLKKCSAENVDSCLSGKAARGSSGLAMRHKSRVR